MIKNKILILYLIIICTNLYANETDNKPISINLGFQLASGFPENDYLKWVFGDNYKKYKNTGWLAFIRGGVYTDLLINFNKYYSLGPEIGLYFFTLNVDYHNYIFFDIPINIIFRIQINRFFLAPYGGLYFMNWDFEDWIRMYNVGGKIGFHIPNRYLRLYTDIGYIFGEYHMIRVALGFNVQLY